MPPAASFVTNTGSSSTHFSSLSAFALALYRSRRARVAQAGQIRVGVTGHEALYVTQKVYRERGPSGSVRIADSFHKTGSERRATVPGNVC